MNLHKIGVWWPVLGLPEGQGVGWEARVWGKGSKAKGTWCQGVAGGGQAREVVGLSTKTNASSSRGKVSGGLSVPPAGQGRCGVAKWAAATNGKGVAGGKRARAQSLSLQVRCGGWGWGRSARAGGRGGRWQEGGVPASGV